MEINTEEEFDEFLFRQGEDSPLLVLFSAVSWCIPCRRFEPHWLKAQDMLPGHFFIQVDMGERPEDTGAHWATEKFGIPGVPTVKLFNDDGVFDIQTGGVVAFVNAVKSYG